jgi:hypothetical protein
MNLNGLFQSKRFWAAAASVAVIVLQDRLPLTPDQITLAVYAIGAWIVGDSIRPSVKPEVTK